MVNGFSYMTPNEFHENPKMIIDMGSQMDESGLHIRRSFLVVKNV
jgi:hypothetical protein